MFVFSLFASDVLLFNTEVHIPHASYLGWWIGLIDRDFHLVVDVIKDE